MPGRHTLHRDGARRSTAGPFSACTSVGSSGRSASACSNRCSCRSRLASSSSAEWKCVNTASGRARARRARCSATASHRIPARDMPVSIWRCQGRPVRAHDSMTAASPSAGVRSPRRKASISLRRMGVNTTIGRVIPPRRSSSPSWTVATPKPHGSSRSSASAARRPPIPYPSALTMGSNGTPARAATAAPLRHSASKSISTQARVMGRRDSLSCEE